MLETIFGNKTAALILLYIGRHGQVCANNLSRGISIPVNMIQKQLLRLEKGGVLISEYRGNRKIYRLNSEFSLFQPLKKLLDMANIVGFEDPADGSFLTAGERFLEAEIVKKHMEELSPACNYKPFVKSFGSFKDYEKWRKKQKEAGLV